MLGGAMTGAALKMTVAVPIEKRMTVAVRLRTQPKKSGYVFAKTSSTGMERYFSMYLSARQVRVYLTTVDFGGKKAKKTVRFSVGLTDGDEHKVLLIRDDDAIRLVVDGVQIGDARSLGGLGLVDCNAAGPECVTYLGQRASTRSGGAYHFTGFLHEFRTYNNVLSAYPSF
jgi:hypothetical protein